MRTTRTLAAAAFAASVAVSAVFPAVASAQSGPTEARAADRGVLICARDTASRRAFARQHGAQPVFITAREVVALRPSEPAWTTPRCMTEREHARLRDAVSANARAN